MTDRSPVDQAYWERNQLVLHLTHIYPSWWGWDEGGEIEEGWGHVVYIQLPTGQASWHIHDHEFNHYFTHLKHGGFPRWDGHTTDEKYKRLRAVHD